jgi:pilus assembly protein CpaE
MDEQKQITVKETFNEMIVFASAKGGVGKTVISVNMAVALADRGFSTCIIDGNFQFGDVNLALDIQPKFTIGDAAQDDRPLTSSILSNYLLEHSSGVDVLSAPLRPEYADMITTSLIQNVCEKAMVQHEYLVVDLSPGLSEHNLTFMEQANKIYIVTDLEMAALKNTKAMIKILRTLGMGDKIKVIGNRGDMEGIVKFKDVPGILEVESLYFISDSFNTVSKSFNIGVPFVTSKPKEKISVEILELAGELYKDRYAVRRKKRKKHSLFDFFKR